VLYLDDWHSFEANGTARHRTASRHQHFGLWECLSSAKVYGDSYCWHQNHGTLQTRLLGKNGMLDLRGLRHVASISVTNCKVYGATKTSSPCWCNTKINRLICHETYETFSTTFPQQPPLVIETFDDEKIPDDKDHKRDRDVSFSMAALPIPLGPLGGLTSLAGLNTLLLHFFSFLTKKIQFNPSITPKHNEITKNTHSPPFYSPQKQNLTFLHKKKKVFYPWSFIELFKASQNFDMKKKVCFGKKKSHLFFAIDSPLQHTTQLHCK
jgi:hypothetical protein